MKHFKHILLLLPLLYYSCTDDILQDLDTVAAQNEEQDARIDSLLTIITDQQEYIDSLNNIQHIADSLQLVYIDSLIHEGEIADSLVQLYTDSLNTTQQAYIDSLINLGNVSDSLLQVYTDSLIAVQNTLNTTQQAYIDSLHNAQQTTLTALANSALNAGFVETEVYSGVPPTTTWTDLDLSDVVGTKRSLVLVKYTGTVTITIRPNGETQNWVDGWSSNVNSTSMISTDGDGNLGYGLILTGNDGIIEWKSTSDWCSTTTCTATLSVVFYLNQ